MRVQQVMAFDNNGRFIGTWFEDEDEDEEDEDE